MTSHVFYGRPAAVGSRLGVEPALASWDKSGSPGQARSAAFISEVSSAIAWQVDSIADPLALRLDVTLPDASVSDLLARNDLDNYLFPLVPKLTERTGRQFASVWAIKQRSGNSAVAVCQAQPTQDPGGEYSLGPILGHDPGAHEWNPRDGRITDLGLHRFVDPAAGNQVTIAIRASHLNGAPPGRRDPVPPQHPGSTPGNR